MNPSEPAAITIQRIDDATDFPGDGVKTFSADPQLWSIRLHRRDGTAISIILTASGGYARDIRITGTRPEEHQ